MFLETSCEGNQDSVTHEQTVTKCLFLPQEKQLSCVANQNGSQAECELGNPFKRNSSVGDASVLRLTVLSTSTVPVDLTCVNSYFFFFRLLFT